MAPEQKPAVQSSARVLMLPTILWFGNILYIYSGPSPIIYRKCMQYTGDVHFIYIICSELVIGLTDRCWEKNLLSVVLFLVLQGRKKLKEVQS